MLEGPQRLYNRALLSKLAFRLSRHGSTKALTDFHNVAIRSPIGQGNNGVSHRPQDSKAMDNGVLRPPVGLEDVFLTGFERVQHLLLSSPLQPRPPKNASARLVTNISNLDCP